MIFYSKILVQGIVQGVGFRPFVYKLAEQLRLTGCVYNDSRGVVVELEGEGEVIDVFVRAVRDRAPRLASVRSIAVLESSHTAVPKYRSFEILESVATYDQRVLVPPDVDVCADCLRELFDPGDRRYRYPFINCTNCGPRYSLIKGMPYDRAITTMSRFIMCDLCAQEYENPLDRRFHAQPNACWQCGPSLELRDAQGYPVSCNDVIEKSVSLIEQGTILAVKGIGGFHLIADPKNVSAVARLRKNKGRMHKPFALVARGASVVKKYCEVAEQEECVLCSTERPIVFLRKRSGHEFADGVAPFSNFFGVMLASTPLHYLLLERFEALICTSANLKGEPMFFTNDELQQHASLFTDYVLTHDRDIYTRVDDSIVSCVRRGGDLVPQIVRRARGYAPKPITLRENFSRTGLALGADLKNTVCVNRGSEFFLSQHIGDLESLEVRRSHVFVRERLISLLGVHPQFLVADMHPDFLRLCEVPSQKDLPVVRVQHHHAHMASCMAENDLSEDVIGVVFDGSGYGPDGCFWGGEFLVGGYRTFDRMGHFSYMKLLGGDQAVHEPYRMALSLLFDSFGGEVRDLGLNVVDARTDDVFRVLSRMHQRNIRTFLTSSVGRLFDAVSALLSICETTEYEGQAAIELEQRAYLAVPTDRCFEYTVGEQGGRFVVDTPSLFRCIVMGARAGDDASYLSMIFQNTLCAIVVDVVGRIRARTGLKKVVLSGGVFQNRYVLERSIERLTEAGFEVFIHRNVPCNDGGISLGQLVVSLGS